jgi:hypothetical protein
VERELGHCQNQIAKTRRAQDQRFEKTTRLRPFSGGQEVEGTEAIK